MASILIAGGSGLVGIRLSHILQKKGHEVLHLSRKKNIKATFPAYQWNLDRGIVDQEAIERADYVVNLAGASIAGGRWTRARKKQIIDSRVRSNKILHLAFAKAPQPPKAYFSASAIGYYGHTGDRLAHEKSEPGVGFLTESVLEWEKSIRSISESGIRTVVFRIGIVLSSRGGAFQKLFPSYRLFTGIYFGNGRQFYSWIHIDDLCRMFLMAIKNKNLHGVYNAVGPQPSRIKTIARDIALAKNTKAVLLPIPVPLLQWTMGEMSEMLLFSTRVSAQKISTAGFEFQFPTLIPAIRDVLKRGI